MTDKLNTALSNVEMTYSELVDIADDITRPIFNPINELVNSVSKNINSMSVEFLRNNILLIQLKAFEISEIKEKSAMKAEVASYIQKLEFAKKFNEIDGTAAAKEKKTMENNSEEIVSEVLYNLIANLFKIKLDSLYRLVDSLKSVLMSRMQENKFMNISVGEKGEKTYLTE